ncbi:MAG TPA: hypothetical protein V6C65_13935, partial [Allocoleopsis sp.]
MINSNSAYADLEKDHRVATIKFVGGGLAVVVLKAQYTNKGQTTITAPFFRTAKEFVDGATRIL